MAAVKIEVSPSVIVKSASERRFHVVKIVKSLPSMEVIHAEVEARSDSKAVAVKKAERSFRSPAQVIVRRVFDREAMVFI